MTESSHRTSFIRPMLIGLSLVALGIMAWRVADIFVVAFGGVVLAAALRAGAEPLARWTGCSTRAGVGIALAGAVIGLVLLGWLFGSQASSEMTGLQQQLPEAYRKFEAWMQQSDLGRSLLELVKKSAADAKALAGLGQAAGAAVGSLFDLLLIGFVGIYLALDPTTYRDGALRLLPPGRRAPVAAALDDAGDSLRRWLLGQMIAMVTVGLVAGTGLALLGVPLAFSLGVFMGLCEFVPVVGPIVAAVPGILLAFSKSPQLAFYALILYVVVQQLEGNVLIPLIQRWATRLAPAIGLLAVVVFGILFGAMGVVFATPIAVVIMAMVKHLYVEDTLEHPRAARAVLPRAPKASTGRAARSAVGEHGR